MHFVIYKQKKFQMTSSKCTKIILNNTAITISQSKIGVIEISIEGSARSHFKDRNLTFQKVLMH